MKKSGIHPEDVLGSGKLPLFLTSTFVYENAGDLNKQFQILLGWERPKKGEQKRYIYSRFDNPNVSLLEEEMVRIEEGTQAALAFPSGMSAIFTTVFSLLKPDQMIIYTKPVYGCTEDLFQKICLKFSIKTLSVDTSDVKKVERALIKHKSKVAMLFLETPANPNLRLSDISAISELARQYENSKKKIWVVVDNTFMGPVFQKPLTLGADIVIYSATKFLGGHSDLLGGMVLTKKEHDIEPIRFYRNITGPVISPLTCWLISRSLETLELRMKAQAQTASQIARFLANHPKVEKVLYPGLLSPPDPQYVIYEKQCLDPGSMISFYLKKSGEKTAFRFINRLKKIKNAVSLGGTESLIENPRTTTHLAVPLDILKASGVTVSMIRLSVGLEPTDVLINDLKSSLDRI